MMSTLIFVIGTALIFRPDHDAMHIWSYQTQHNEPDMRTRQLEAEVRYLRGEGLAFDKIKQLLGGATYDKEVIDKITELETIHNARQRLIRFAATILVPPIIILELSILWLLVRSGVRLSRRKCTAIFRRSTS